VVRPPGFEPGIAGSGDLLMNHRPRRSPSRRHQLTTDLQLMIDNLREFEKWLRRKGISEITMREYLRYVSRFKVLTPRLILSKKLSKNCIKALRNYVHFNYEIGLLSEEQHDRFLKLLKLPRQSKLPKIEEVSEEEVRKTFKKLEREDIRLVYEVLLFSGCRLSEALKLLSSFESKRFKKINSEYGRYMLMSERGSKRALWLYLPNSLADGITKIELSRHTITTYARKRKILVPKLIRKFFYQKAYEIIKDRELVDFYQGRVSRLSIGSRHYDSLLARADREYEKILTFLDKLLMYKE